MLNNRAIQLLQSPERCCNASMMRCFMVNVCALAWSYTLMLYDGPLLRVAEEVLKDFAKNHVLPHKPSLEFVPHIPRILPSEVLPRITSLKGMCIVMKPPGWEVDSEGYSGPLVSLRVISEFFWRSCVFIERISCCALSFDTPQKLVKQNARFRAREHA